MVAPKLKRAFLSALLGFLPAVLISKGVTERLEPHLLRQWFVVRGDRDVPRDVTIVRLDKPAYDLVNLSIGEMFPRDRLAEAIANIAAGGARVVVLDAVFQRKGDNPDADEFLGRVLADTPSVIGRHTDELIDIDAEGRRRMRRFAVNPVEPFRSSAKFVIPLEVRLLNGVVREICLSNDRHVLSDVRVPLLEPLRSFVSPNLPEPGGFDFINFYGGPNTLTSISLADVLEKDIEELAPYFEDRAVLIGVAAGASAGIEAAKDTFLTSISRSPMFGVEIHATIAANLLDQSWIRRPSEQAEFFIMGIAALGLSFLVLGVGPLAAPAIAVAAAAVWFGLSYYAFLERHYFIPGLTLFAIIVPLAVLLRWSEIVFWNWRNR